MKIPEFLIYFNKPCAVISASFQLLMFQPLLPRFSTDTLDPIQSNITTHDPCPKRSNVRRKGAKLAKIQIRRVPITVRIPREKKTHPNSPVAHTQCWQRRRREAREKKPSGAHRRIFERRFPAPTLFSGTRNCYVLVLSSLERENGTCAARGPLCAHAGLKLHVRRRVYICILTVAGGEQKKKEQQRASDGLYRCSIYGSSSSHGLHAF